MMASKENRLDSYDVYQLLKSRSDEWVEIGRELKLPTSFCNGLDKKGPVYSDDTKLDKVINEWLETWCSPPTWDNLIKALERLKWKSVAEDVIKFLTTDPEANRKYNWKPEAGVEPDAKVCKIPEKNVSNQPSSTASEESFITAVDDSELSDSNLDDVLEATISVSDWKSLGLKLKLEKYQLDDTDDNNRGKVKDCRREMISLWLNTGDASWRALVRALASQQVGKKGLAKEIAKKHRSINP